MCGRFINLNSNKKLKNIFEINDNKDLENTHSYNIAPSQESIIIVEVFYHQITLP